MTKNAAAVLNIVNESYDHPTAEDIFLKLKAKKSKMVLATVYNNLNRLCEKGLIRRLSIDGVSDRFDKIRRHDHLYCVSCGQISDLEFTDLTKLIEEKLGLNIISYDLNIKHLCEECRKTEKNKAQIKTSVSKEKQDAG
ncbi:MAG: transcriptional repressor [Treponemataceae bacterium]